MLDEIIKRQIPVIMKEVNKRIEDIEAKIEKQITSIDRNINNQFTTVIFKMDEIRTAQKEIIIRLEKRP